MIPTSEECEDAKHGSCRVNNCCCKCHQRDTLTFAEAMALDPSEVEYTRNCVAWASLDGALALLTLATFRRECKFRRSRPKRSRVEEMADAKWQHREQTGTLLDESHIERRFLEPR